MPVRALIAAAILVSAVQQPTFRTRVDLIRLDVRVMDKAGLPVRGLRPDDFVVTVDGKPRKVTFAQFYGPDDVPPQQGAEAPVVVGTNTTSTPGRVVVVVIDLESIEAGSEKPIFETTAALVERLSPADAVGLLVLPGKGVEITRDRQKVRDAIKELRGWAPPAPRYTISVRDAEGIRNGDAMVMRAVYERECNPPTSEMCQREIMDMVKPMLMDADRRTMTFAGTLGTLFAKLEPIQAPKSVVLLSAGLQRRFGNEQAFDSLRQRSAAAGIALSVVQVEQPEHDVSRKTLARRATRGDALEGLSAIASAAQGSFYYGVASAAGAFERIRSEILYSYQLGVESSPSDADDRRHKLKVEVKRPGVTVRTHKEILIPKIAVTEVSPVDVLVQPVDLMETPIAAGLFTTRGDDPSTLKVILLAELLGGKREAGTASYAFAVQQDGKNVFETAGRFANGASRAAIATQLAPGRYRLRTAVLDAANRAGSTDIPIVVGLRQAGALQFSDLIVGDTRAGTFLPMTRASVAAAIETAIELYSTDPGQFEGLSVSIEARRPADPKPSVQVPAELGRTDSDRRRYASARLAAGALTPGTWIVTAVARRGDAVVGQVSRVLGVD